MKTVKATITRISDSAKSVMLFVPENPTALENPLTAKNAVRTNAYVTLPDGVKKTAEDVGKEMEIPVGYTLQSKQDEDGNTMQYSDGNPVLFIQW